ncbi:MAG: hypothetical protein DRI65_09740 [Chloroflexota bacterium]|nr:MAG: hypothetical protein DRI65_09740 [Chloroflexota bacterium]HDD62512.1 hypothetical protein [Chloroflexota bacterium]
MINKISGTILYLFSVLVYRTCRFTITGFEQIEELIKTNKPVIVTSWHGMTMMVAGFINKMMDFSEFSVIMPDDYRGDVLAIFADHLGVEPLKVNLSGDSTFGLGRKLVSLMKKMRGGKKFLIHPDGPAGPAYKVKPGLSFIAQKTGAAILPLGCYCRNAYHINRWDRYTLPLPFSKVHIQLGSLMTIPEEVKDLKETNRMIEDVLNRVALQASANYYLE